MKQVPWQVWVGLIFIICAVSVYLLKSFLIGHVDDTVNYLFNATGFLFLNVLIITLVLNELIQFREKRERLIKVNMVIEVFFSEIGRTLLGCFCNADPEKERLHRILAFSQDWDDRTFAAGKQQLEDHEYEIAISTIDLTALKAFLKEKKMFLLRLYENPALLEHGSFSPLLQSVFHLAEELENRKDLSSLPESDLVHLSGDIRRVYSRLTGIYLQYIQHLHRNYPYLFSLAVRINPFNEKADVIVIES